jgi:hypothetical protein
MPQFVFETRVISVATGGMLHDSGPVVSLRDSGLPPVRPEHPGITIIDLGAATLTPGVLQDLVLPAGQKMRAGVYGQMNVVFSSSDPVTQNFVGMIAAAHDLALYVTFSPENVLSARPVGNLTPTEYQTLNVLAAMGGTTTAAGLAQRLEIDQTTAGNRLVGLARKGFIQRLPRPRPGGDLFIDPRSIPLHSSLF